jgi:FMN phosphatase YigB (HAD superfamily)
MSNNIKFIYFDLGGVFFHWQQAVKDLADYFNRPLEEFNKIRITNEDAVCRGKISIDDYWQKYVNGLNLNHPKDFDFSDFFVSHFIAIPETHRLVKELILEYPIGILTNVFPTIYEKQIILKLVPALDYNPVIQSDQVGLVKPEEGIFRLAQEKCGFTGNEIFYIDDIKQNVEVAFKLGWKTYWFNEKNPKKSVADIRSLLGEQSE